MNATPTLRSSSCRASTADASASFGSASVSIARRTATSLTAEKRARHWDEPLVLREVDADYISRGDGLCYRLLRSISCLKQLVHPNLLQLQAVNLSNETNRVQLLFEDGGDTVPVARLDDPLGGLQRQVPDEDATGRCRVQQRQPVDVSGSAVPASACHAPG